MHISASHENLISTLIKKTDQRITARMAFKPLGKLGKKAITVCLLSFLTLPVYQTLSLAETPLAKENKPATVSLNTGTQSHITYFPSVLKSHRDNTLYLYESKGLPESALSTLQNSLKHMGINAKTVTYSDLNAFENTSNTTLIIPIGRFFTPQEHYFIKKFARNGGHFVLFPTGQSPLNSVSKVLEDMDIELVGARLTQENHAYDWYGSTKKENDAPATLPANLKTGQQVLLVKAPSKKSLIGVWRGESSVPAIIQTEQATLLNWDITSASNTTANLIFKHIFGTTNSQPVVANNTAVPTPLPPQEAPNQTQSTIVIPKPLDPKSNGNNSISQSPFKVLPATQKPESTTINTSPSPNSILQQPMDVAKLKTPVIPDPSPVITRESKPQTQPTPAPPTATTEPEKVASIQPTNNEPPLLMPSEPSMGELPTFDENEVESGEFADPLNFMDEEKEPVQKKGKSLQDQIDFDLKTLNAYKNRVEDALESSMQLNLGLPVSEAQKLIRSADIHMALYQLHAKERVWYKADMEYYLARSDLSKALVITSMSPRIEGRAIWLDRGSIVGAESPMGMRKMLKKLKKAGINVIYLETINAGYPIYPSKYITQNPLVTEFDWNPLEVAVKEGHKLGMEVHAWVWVFAVGNKRHNPLVGKPLTYPGPILEDAGMMSEAMQGPSGNLLPDGKQHEFWLSPASPKARTFLKNVFSEIVENYDVDGLQLDYIRYPFQKPGTQMGFEPISRQRFAQSTGGSPSGGSKLWIAWKTYQVNSFVKEVSETLKAIKPDLKLSAAVFPMPRASRIVAIQQDWETWIDNGWIDTLSPMSYTTSPAKLRRTLNYVVHATKKRGIIYPGIAIHRLDAAELVEQLDTARAAGAMGSTLFAMAHLDDSKVIALESGPYKEKRVISPHQNPAQSIVYVLEDYQEKFGILMKNQELEVLTTAEIHALHHTLGELKDFYTPLQVKTSSPESKLALIRNARPTLENLRAQTLSWLTKEKTEHPFRVQYFGEMMTRLDQLLLYFTDKTVVASQH